MKKILYFNLLILFLIPGLTSGQDDPVIQKIIDLGRSDNKVMKHMDYLTNRFGDRMTGSDNYYSACVWAVNTMRSWGMMAEMQEAGEMPVGFNRGPWFGKMTAPTEQTLDFGTPAYTAGTKGKQKGQVVIAPATRVLYHKVESWDKLPALPDIKLIDKQYNEIKSLVRKGEKVELEFDIRNYFRPGPIKYHNVIGWIPGTIYPDEYVILGGHLDGLAGATGAVDNASGAAPAMEAARLILAAGGKPKRTIMVQLWAAEELGLLGSKAWVEQSPDKLPRISAVFNKDGGTNCISGLSVPKAMMADFTAIVKPVLGLYPRYPFELTERTRPARKGGRGGTDAFSFLRRGVPAFGFSIKGEHQYGRTWHTTIDTYNEVIPEYQEYSSMVTAVVAYGISNLDHLLSRDGYFMPDGIYADFNTNKGRISVLLDYKKAPMTVANFIGLAEGTITNASYPLGTPFYNGSIWHRVVKGHVIQGGSPVKDKAPEREEVSATGYVIPNEISDLSHNKAGMIGIANSGPHTNTCQYYITLGDRSYLDGDFTLFGEVVEGMDVVNKIVQGDTTYTISIVRAGEDAEKFIVNDETFGTLVERQWRKVKIEEEMKRSKDEKFISDNYTGLTTTSSGLRYKVLIAGKGNPPATAAILSVIYSGRLINGLSFGSTADNGKPAMNIKPVAFTCTAGKDPLIKGLQEALAEMKQGEKRLLVIPSGLAYGRNGFYAKDIPGQKRFVISPNEILILKVTLISFK